MTTPVKSQRFRLRRTRPRAAAHEARFVDLGPQPEELVDEEQDNMIEAESAPVVVKTRKAAKPQSAKPERSAARKERAPRPAGDAPEKTDLQDRQDRPDAVREASDRPRPPAAPSGNGDTAHMADQEGSADTAKELDAIRAEGLTARQLRMAMRVAKKHGIRPSSGFEAVLMLRKRGVDPFARGTLLDLAKDQPPEQSRDLALRKDTPPRPPQRWRPARRSAGADA